MISARHRVDHGEHHPGHQAEGQVPSLLSLVSYLGSGNYRDRYLGIKIPPTNLQATHVQAAREFADALANRLLSTGGGHLLLYQRLLC